MKRMKFPSWWRRWVREGRFGSCSLMRKLKSPGRELWRRREVSVGGRAGERETGLTAAC